MLLLVPKSEKYYHFYFLVNLSCFLIEVAETACWDPVLTCLEITEGKQANNYENCFLFFNCDYRLFHLGNDDIEGFLIVLVCSLCVKPRALSGRLCCHINQPKSLRFNGPVSRNPAVLTEQVPRL